MPNISDRLLSLIYPTRCACCRKLIANGEDLCDNCKREIKYIDPLCSRCGLSKKGCRCRIQNFLFSGAVSVFENNGVAQNGIYALKFRKHYQASKFFGREMAKSFKKHFPNVQADFVCEVPVYVKDKKRINHATLIAKAFSKETGFKYQKDVITKPKRIKTQHEVKTLEERVKNVKGAYKVTKELDGKTVILIDDIRTSAATLNECAKQLRLKGAVAVYCATALSSTIKKEK